MARILVVDDEANILQLLKYNLEGQGYDVCTAADGIKALEALDTGIPDLIILDLMLPAMDGYEVCRRLRSRPDTAAVPIIMLTAKSEEFDKVLGLEMGADDYVTKPFSPRELLARVKAHLRRPPKREPAEKTVIAAGYVTLNPDKYEVLVEGELVDLTLKEFELLKMLISNPGKVLKRDYLLEQVWGYGYTPFNRTIDVHVHSLRQKIDRSSETLIETVRGIGYRFRDVRPSHKAY